MSFSHTFDGPLVIAHDWHQITCRYGEALHPGPLSLGSFNPGQILGNESIIANWGDGVWAASESSHTKNAMRLSSSRLRKQGFQSIWSPPVAAHSHNAESLRGRASGTAVVSSLPMYAYPSQMPEAVAKSSRCVEAIVDLGGSSMYIASLYGPANGVAHFDPWALLSAGYAFQHALAFRGPAAVVGDFNTEAEAIPYLSALRKRGWVDAALYDAHRRSSEPRPTCKDKSRKTYIFVNPVLLQALEWCDTIEQYDFDAHPLLLAKFNWDILRQDRLVWHLPQSLDPISINRELLDERAVNVCESRKHAFEQALQYRHVDEAFRQVNVAFEQVIAGAAVDESHPST